MKTLKLCTAFLLACTYFLMPISAKETTITFGSTKEENQGQLSISGSADMNAFSLNLKLDGDIKLESMSPSDALISQGARVNYVYQQDTNTLDIYVTSKKNLTYDQKLDIATMNFSGKDGSQVSVSLNDKKDGLKTVRAHSGTVVAPKVNVTPFTLTSKTPDEDDDDHKDPNTVEVNYKDDETGVSIHAPAGVLPAGTTADIAVVEDTDSLKAIQEKLKEQSSKFVVYDITLWNNGKTVQPKEGSLVSVRLPIPSGYDKEKLAVFGVDGDLEIFDIAVDGDEVVFKTSHFSNYAIAEKNAETIPVNPDPSTPDKDDTTTPPEKQPDAKDPTNTTDPNHTDSTKDESGVETGDSTNTMGLLLLLVGSAVVGIAGYRKYCK